MVEHEIEVEEVQSAEIDGVNPSILGGDVAEDAIDLIGHYASEAPIHEANETLRPIRSTDSLNLELPVKGKQRPVHLARERPSDVLAPRMIPERVTYGATPASKDEPEVALVILVCSSVQGLGGRGRRREVQRFEVDELVRERYRVSAWMG